MRILIADDDLTSRLMLAAALKTWGHEPVVATNGLEAWEALRQPDAPALVVLDWVMPGMDGLEVLGQVRALDTPRPPYIIMLTGRSEGADIVAGLEAGADDYVGKPFNNEELRARLRVGERTLELQARLVEAREALAHQATHDSLTELPNRRAVLDQLGRELSRATRDGAELSIGMCDIDHFKAVNDTHGHQVGDDVLRGFAATMRAVVRDYDLVGRYGGEEFLLVAPRPAGHPRENPYERLRARVASTPVVTRAGEVAITVSIGVASRVGAVTVDALLAEADAALYQAKADGRNRVVYSGGPPGGA